MRGSRLVRGGDPMKTRSQKRKEKKQKLAKTGRVIRQKKRLNRIYKKKCEVQQDSHMTAIMEAYILKRKAERRIEKEKSQHTESSDDVTVKDSEMKQDSKNHMSHRSLANIKASSKKSSTNAKLANSHSASEQSHEMSRMGKNHSFDREQLPPKNADRKEFRGRSLY